MNQELEALEANYTWKITTLPPEKTPIGCKWLYKIIYKPDGSVERYKSRLVVLGNKQKYGVDYEETFAPVAKLTSVRSLLAIASIEGWDLQQMDVKNAYLHGDLQETLYMRMPPRYTHQGGRIKVQQGDEDVAGTTTNLVCKLQKSLYGLKQAPQQWYTKLRQALLNFNFFQSKSDSSLFVKREGNSITVILVYVDDLLVAGNDSKMISRTKYFLSTMFHMKDLGKVRYFLGLEVDQTHQGIFISQAKYTQDLIQEYGMKNCRPLKLPLDTHTKLTPNSGTPLPHPEQYQKLIGKLIYLTLTRPNISFAVHILSTFMHQPTSSHFQAAKRVIRYLFGSVNQGLFFPSSQAAQLTAYCDSD